MNLRSLISALGLLILSTGASQKDPSAEETLIMAALEKLPGRMKIDFKIPFPDWDIDVYRKQPIAVTEVDGGKVSVTQPKMQPYDGHGTIEWMMGPEDHLRLLDEGVDCMLHLDDAGDFLQIGLFCNGDAWSKDDRGTHEISRGDEESGAAFFKRAMTTFRARAKRAKDPALAARIVSTAEKIATTAQVLRKEEAMRTAK